MNQQPFLDSAKRCCENARRLLDEAELLEFEEPPATMYFLSMIAQEEASKAFLLYLVMVEAIPWTHLLLRATRDHRCKQLVGIILDYMSPDFDEFLARIDESGPNRETSRFPATVADAMNLLYHEKIRRWEQETWVWEENPEYDKTALAVAGGRRDREKQHALYVALDKNGRACRTPQSVTKSRAQEEYERGRRFEECVCGLFDEDAGFAWDLKEIQSKFKVLFSQSLDALESLES